MPKSGSQDRENPRSQPRELSRSHPYRKSEVPSLSSRWGEDLSCPICMEPPHNAVILVCEQHERGCKPYMCDTSQRHANCLDQFRKSTAISTQENSSDRASTGQSLSESHQPHHHHVVSHDSMESLSFGLLSRLSHAAAQRTFSFSFPSPSPSMPATNRYAGNHVSSSYNSWGNVGSDHPWLPFFNPATLDPPQPPLADQSHPPPPSGEVTTDTSSAGLPVETVPVAEAPPFPSMSAASSPSPEARRARLLEKVRRMESGFVTAEAGLQCPLCRSAVIGWRAALPAERLSLNRRQRSCANEACTFSGSYSSLRRHARKEHPAARPQQVDPARALTWQRLQVQQDREDVLSTLRSAMPGARVFGDYLIEDDEEEEEDVDGDGEGDGEDGDEDMEGPDLDLILPMLEVMRDLAGGGPSHVTYSRLPWGMGLGARSVRRRGRGSYGPRGSSSSSFVASLPPPVNLNLNQPFGPPPAFPEIPVLPPFVELEAEGAGARMGRWGEFGEGETAGVEVRGRGLVERRRRLITEVIRERMRRGGGRGETEDLPGSFGL